MAHTQVARDFALYNGVSNRSRGWKSRRPGEITEAPAPPTPRHTSIKRWDGKTRTSMAWDGLRRDPELWFRHGNCFVHLYARGQSRRGPAFKLPLSTLLASQCHSLVERFITRDMPTVPDVSDMHDNSMLQPMPMPPPLSTLDYWSRAHLIGRVDLYIPPPRDADRNQTFLYYLAIRNLFAWVFRRPIAGEHLGSALAGLFSAMREFRHPNADNAHDLMCYLEDESYLAMAGHPDYALALLHLAETMQFRSLYIDAFAHCVGMYNDLHLGTEYQYISSASRKLVRRACLDMDLRLGSAGSMLSNFLEDDLSETHLGLPEPARAHLDRFRTYVQGFYASRLGYYPPISIDTRSTIYEPHVYRVLAEDFQALYDFLVNESFTADTSGPALAQGGFCVLQSVKGFDERHGYSSLQNPLPLLPEVSLQSQGTDHGSLNTGNNKGSAASRRMSWFGGKTMDRLLLSRSEKLKPDTRLLTNAAFLKASNKTRPDLWRNEFVCAYRQFEEDSVFKPYKADRMEKISMIDARKVRWILIYAVHQTLRNCFIAPPAEVNGTGAVPYHLSISSNHLPNWEDRHDSTQASSMARSSPDSLTFPLAMTAESPTAAFEDNAQNSYNSDITPPVRCMSMTALPDAPALRMLADTGNERGRALSPVFDIRPDIDYLGLTNRGDTSPLDGEVVMLPRSRSLTRSLSQKAAFRRSLSLFRGNNNTDSTNNSSNNTQLANAPAKLQKGKQPDLTSYKPSEPVPPIPITTKLGNTLQRSFSLSTSGKKQRALSRERKPSPYHEIVVHGYGNGTNPVQLAVSTNVASQDERKGSEDADPSDDSVATPSTSRSLSTSSTNSNTSAATADTALTALTEDRASIGCVSDLPVMVDDTAIVESPTVMRSQSRSSSVYSNASSKATRRENTTPTPTATAAAAAAATFVTLEAPAIPPRGRTRTPQVHSSSAISRSSSMYSIASLKENDMPAPLNVVGMAMNTVVVPTKTPPPPPVPARNSARHRRFSVYGGGDEYAGVLPLATPQRAMSLVPEPKRQQHKNRRGMNNSSHHSRPRPQPHSQPHYQRLDMLQEALLAVRETMEQHQMAVPSSAPISRSSSFVGVAALRSVNEEDDELPTMAMSTSTRTMASQHRSRSHSARHRHSSYHGRHEAAADDDVQPEWEKFAMGLGGHTAV